MLKILGGMLAFLAVVFIVWVYCAHKTYESERSVIERRNQITEKILIHFYEKHGRIVYKNTVKFSHLFGGYKVYNTSEGNVVMNNADEIIECPVCKAKGLYK